MGRLSASLLGLLVLIAHSNGIPYGSSPRPFQTQEERWREQGIEQEQTFAGSFGDVVKSDVYAEQQQQQQQQDAFNFEQQQFQQEQGYDSAEPDADQRLEIPDVFPVEQSSNVDSQLTLSCDGVERICAPKDSCVDGFVYLTPEQKIARVRGESEQCKVNSEICCGVRTHESSKGVNQELEGPYVYDQGQLDFGPSYNQQNSVKRPVTEAPYESGSAIGSEPVLPTEAPQPQQHGDSSNPASSVVGLPAPEVPAEAAGSNPAPTHLQLGCAAALVCVEEQFCTLDGTISTQPNSFTAKQLLRRVPMSDCKNPDNGVIGKCCRDPNYVDPWPTANLPANYSGGFDEQGFPTFLNIAKTRPPKKPVTGGVKGSQPIKPRPPVKTVTRPPFTIPVVPQVPQVPTAPFVPQVHVPVVPAVPQVTPHFPQPSFPQQVINPVPVIPQQPQVPIVQFPQQPSSPVIPFPQQPIQPAPGHVHQVQLPTKTGTYQRPQPIVPVAPQVPNVHLNTLPPPVQNHIEFPSEVPLVPDTSKLIPSSIPLPSSTPEAPLRVPNIPVTPTFQQPFNPAPVDSENGINYPTSVVPQYTPQCGVKNNLPRLTGLHEAENAFGEIPWQAMILHKEYKKILCSGVIIAPDMVLTAAHCVNGLRTDQVSVKTGEWKLGYELKHEEPLPFEIVDVAYIKINPSFTPGFSSNDSAVLVLQRPATFDGHVNSVCLPQRVSYQTKKQCIVTGWGKSVIQVHAAGAIMRTINVDLMSHEECSQRVSYAENQVDINGNVICARPHQQNHNMCQVEDGSPLACDRGDGVYELVGVYSQDTGCLPTNQVAVFTPFDLTWMGTSLSALSPPKEDVVQHVPSSTPAHEYENQESLSDARKSHLPAGINQYLPPV